MTKIVFASDFHVPYEDKEAIEKLYEFCKKYKPQVFIWGGDICDFYQVSSFSKQATRALELKEDLKKTHELFGRFRKLLPKAEMYLVKSNHHSRMENYLMRHPELAGLDCLTEESLLKLEKFNIKLVDYIELGNTIFYHGERCSSQSGSTAANEMKRWGTNGVTGHVHRLGVHYKTTYKNTLKWIEAGCMCLKQDYCGVTPPDWNQGFVVGTFDDNSTTLYPVYINDNLNMFL